MSAPSTIEACRDDELTVQVVGPADGWVLERLARIRAAKLPYAEFVPWRPRPARQRASCIMSITLCSTGQAAVLTWFFSRAPDENHQSVEQGRRADACVCMARQYADWLAAQGVQTAVHIPMGFDYYRFRPRLVLGVVGRLEHPRRAGNLVEAVQKLPFVEVVTTEGRTPPEELRALLRAVGLCADPGERRGRRAVPAGGSGVGKPVIAPEGVGVTPEFGPTEHIRFGTLGELKVPAGVNTAALEQAVNRAAWHLFFGRYGLARAALTIWRSASRWRRRHRPGRRAKKRR